MIGSSADLVFLYAKEQTKFMIATNQLLSIAFAVISNFANVVEIPQRELPQQQEDLTKILIGTPNSPLDMYLVHKQGSEFWLSDGVVYQYYSPVSFFHMQDFSRRAGLVGPATLSSNEVVRRAIGVMERLVKNGAPLDRTVPKVQATAAPDLHFYYVSWPFSNSPFSDGLGAVEIDARSGRIATVTLLAPEFYDLAFAAEISNRVYSPAPPRKPLPNPAATMPKPTTNQVEALIPKWLYFCQRLRVNPGSQTNVADLDWVESVVFTNANRAEPGALFKIQFLNRTVFESFNGRIVAHCCGDAAFGGFWADESVEHWKKFAGTPVKTWQDLADDLDSLLIQQLDAPRDYLAKFRPVLCSRGGGGTRHLVRWCDSEKLRGHQWYELRDRPPILAEFDLVSGEIKIIRLDSSQLLGWQNR